KLTQTNPLRLEDNPAYVNYPGDNGHVNYGGGIFVGYRYYEKKQLVPLFHFCYGLSYTTFSHYNLHLSVTHMVRYAALTFATAVRRPSLSPRLLFSVEP